MVGPPKTLMDLRRVEGALRLTCRTCGTSRMVDREEMIFQRSAHRQSLEWAAVRADQRCGAAGCDSRDIKVEGVPFGENAAELRAHRAQMYRLNLALQVLDLGAARTSTLPEPAIKLALRVLHPYVGQAELLTTYWSAVTAERRGPWGGGHQALRWIVTKLVERGYPVWAEYR